MYRSGTDRLSQFQIEHMLINKNILHTVGGPWQEKCIKVVVLKYCQTKIVTYDRFCTLVILFPGEEIDLIFSLDTQYRQQYYNTF